MPPYNMTRTEMMFAVSGGILVSIAVCMFYIIFGKLLSKTTLISQLLKFKYSPDFAIRMTAFAGVVFSAAFLKELYHEHFISFWPFDSKAFERQSEESVLIVSGLLIGFGSMLSGGCTFGHGVVGIPRLNLWSLLAVITFCTTAYYTNKWDFVSLIPKQSSKNNIFFDLPDNINTDIYIEFLFLVPFIFYILSKDKSLVGLAKFIVAFLIGITAGVGMMIGGVTKRELVLSMFQYNLFWDPTIIVFFMTTIIINTVVFTFVIKKEITPVFATKVDNPKGKPSLGLFIGAICFGIGWGLGGLCPGSSYLLLPLKSLKIPVYFVLSMCAGIKIAQVLTLMKDKMNSKNTNQTANQTQIQA